MRALPRSARQGQEAVARYRVIERRGDRALIEIIPQTGRTHQLRVQPAAEQMPIAGDALYGGPPAPRLMLHAAELSLTHPTTRHRLLVRSPPPAAFAAWLAGKTSTDMSNVDDVERALPDAAAPRYRVAHDNGTNAIRIA